MLEFLEKWQISLDVLMDKNGDLLKDWRVYVFPTSFVIDPAGRLEKIYDNVRAKGHVERLLRELA